MTSSLRWSDFKRGYIPKGIPLRVSRNSEVDKIENIYENGLWIDIKLVKIEE